jgi:hypothetical protein
MLRNVIFEIFGDMFFMFPDDYEEDVTFPSDWIKYSIRISREDKRALFINCYFTPGQAAVMAENFLGMEAEDISDIIIAETIKEAVNVISGNLLNKLGEEYQMGIPANNPTEDTAFLKKMADSGDALLLNVENEPFLAAVTYN